MDKCSVEDLDGLFGALADPTRRQVVRVLGNGPESIGNLARATSAMTLPAFMKHIAVLERCGLVRTTKRGRVRTCTIDRARLGLVSGWLDEQRAVWEARTDRLERFLIEMEES